jgi:pimeloyl-ACP methyl ester carboxylesterase
MALSQPPLWRETRFPAERLALAVDPVMRCEGVPEGDGSAVLLIAGFMAGDPTLGTMAGWLKRLGYAPRRAGLRANVDCATRAADRLEERVRELHAETGRRVSIVGQSRGGTLARLLAHRAPESVAGIVTLGSPLLDELAVHPWVKLNVRLVAALGTLRVPGLFSHACGDGECCAASRDLAACEFPGGVGFVSVHSRSDGIVDWRSCVHPAASNVHVGASHCGMAVNADVYRVIARSLAGFAAAEAAAPPPQVALGGRRAA